MSEQETYKKEIENLRHIYNICIELLEFDKQAEYRKEKLRKLGIEVIDKKNYNRVKTIERELKRVKTHKHLPGNELNIAVLKETGMSMYQPELHEYIVKLYGAEYKENMLESIKRIIECEEKLHPKTKKKIEKSHSNKNSLKKIIRKHMINSNSYLEAKEINQIKEQFGIELFDEKEGYLSDETISKLFTIRIVDDSLSKHDEINLKSIVDSIDVLFELTITEMGYIKDPSVFGTRGIIKYEKTLNSIEKIEDKNYVEKYFNLYEKIIRHYNKLSKEQKEEFNLRLSKSKYKYDHLLNPEEFRQRVNDKAKEIIYSLDYSEPSDKYDLYNVVEVLTKYTKYMTNEEITSCYHTIKENDKNYEPQTLQHIFAILLIRRMKVIEYDMTEEESEDLKNKRYKAICNEYFNENPLFINSDNVVVSSDYAKESMQTKVKVYTRK